MTRFFQTMLILVLVAGAAPVFAESGRGVLDAIQKKYDATKTFKARFIQNAYLKVMDQTQRAQGTVFIKKPGKMKWTYTAPDPQVLVSDSDTLWLYLPEEKQVTRMQVESIYSNNTPALFLSGEGRLAEQFHVDSVITEGRKIVVELLPRKPEQNLSKLVLYADKNTFQIVGSRVYDNFGNTTEMFFTQIETNPSIPDALFEFDVPAGVELIDLATPQP